MTIERITGEESHPEAPTGNCGDTASAEQVEVLQPEMGGRWEVQTRSSTHIWDLDHMTYTRLPGTDSAAMPFDGQEVPLSRVDAWPAVGHRTLLFFDDPQNPLREHWRICSRIRSITRLPEMPSSEGG